MLKRIFKTFLGSFIVSAGIVILLHANAGADPLGVLILGIINQFGDFAGRNTFGILSMSLGLMFITIAFFIDRTKVGIGSLINSLSIGSFINFLYALNFDLLIPNIPLFSFIIGPVVMGIGLAVYLSAGLGAGSAEAIMVILDDRLFIDLKFIRILQDASFVLIGLLLGATFGWGIVSSVLLIGPTIEMTLKIINKKKG